MYHDRICQRIKLGDNIMSIFKRLTKGLIDTALLPVDIAKDVATLGGTLINEESATAERVEKLKDNAEKIYDSLEDDD
jgi:hypothetical protein